MRNCLTDFLNQLAKLAVAPGQKPADVIPIKPTPGPVPVENVSPVPLGVKKVLMIDVSHYEPVPDYVKLKANGVEAVYAKASEHGADSLFRAHIKAAQAAGLPCGGYHFFRASSDVQAQLDIFKFAIAGLKLELKHCLDWEVSDGEPSGVQKQKALAWLKAIKAEFGHSPIIYGGESFLHDLALGKEFEEFALWLAHYGCAESHLKIPSPWAAFAGWQYTDAESIPGLAGGHHVDASLIHLERFKV